MAGKQNKRTGSSKQKLSAKQVEQRRIAAEQRAAKEKEARAKKERGKRIFTLVVCIILVLALGLPTIALSVLGPGL